MARWTKDDVRRAIVSAMKAEPTITALVPAASILPPQPPSVPTWPFILYGVMISTPLRASGSDGATLTGAIHCYAKGPGDEGCGAITGAVAAFLDGPEDPDDHGPKGLSLTIPAASCVVQVASDQVIADGSDANSWHGIINLRIMVTA